MVSSEGAIEVRLEEGEICAFTGVEVLLLLGPILMPEFWIFVLKLLAAFWAAENIDEKKPDAFGGPLAVDSRPSTGGERGADVMCDSLLGPWLTEPDLDRRCALIFREGGLPSEDRGGLEPRQGAFQSDAKARAVWASTGVGGVFTIAGA